MPHNRLQSRAVVLAARVEGLAAALHESRVPEEAAARLLSHASAAVLQALTLELLLEQPVSATEPERRLEPELPVAA